MLRAIRKYILLLPVLLTLILTTACWNNRDITDIAIAVGIGLDKTESGEIEITIEMVNPSAIQSEEGSGNTNLQASIEVSATGETVFAAARNLIGTSSKKMFFSHIQVVIIGESLARDGLQELIDFWERDHETRRKAYFIIASGVTAKEVLKTQSVIESLTSIHLAKILEASNAIGKIQMITLFEIIQQMHEPGRGVVIGIISPTAIEGNMIEDMEPKGAAVFKHGKLIDFLTPSQTRGFLFAVDDIKSTILTVTNPLDKERLFSVEVLTSEGNVDAKFENNELMLKIKVEAIGNLGEIVGEKSIIKYELLNTLQGAIEAVIKEEIDQVAKKAQQELYSDIFGFGGVLYRHQYEEWTKIQEDWEDIFANTPIDIEVKFRLNSTGLIKEPAFTNLKE